MKFYVKTEKKNKTKTYTQQIEKKSKKNVNQSMSYCKNNRGKTVTDETKSHTNNKTKQKYRVQWKLGRKQINQKVFVLKFKTQI